MIWDWRLPDFQHKKPGRSVRKSGTFDSRDIILIPLKCCDTVPPVLCRSQYRHWGEAVNLARDKGTVCLPVSIHCHYLLDLINTRLQKGGGGQYRDKNLLIHKRTALLFRFNKKWRCASTMEERFNTPPPAGPGRHPFKCPACIDCFWLSLTSLN